MLLYLSKYLCKFLHTTIQEEVLPAVPEFLIEALLGLIRYLTYHARKQGFAQPSDGYFEEEMDLYCQHELLNSFISFITLYFDKQNIIKSSEMRENLMLTTMSFMLRHKALIQIFEENHSVSEQMI